MDIVSIGQAVAQSRRKSAQRPRLTDGILASVYSSLSVGGSAAIQVQGDSTGDATDEWVYGLASRLAAETSAAHVKYKLWSDTAQDFSAWTVIQAGAGERYANFPATARSMFLPSAEFSWNQDMDVRVRLAADDWTPASTMVLIGKWGAAGQYAWTLNLATSGQLVFRWSSDGTFVQQLVGATTPSFVDGQEYWVRATLQRDNGAGGYTAKLYTSPANDGVTWTEVGSVVTSGGATSITASSTADYELGGQGFSSQVFKGKIFEAQVRAGINGYILNPQPIDAWIPRPAGSGFVAGSFGGGPTLYVINGSFAGSSYNYHAFDPRHSLMVQPYYGSTMFQSMSHNDGDNLGAAYLTAREAWITKSRTRCPGGQVVLVTQNPEIAPVDPHSISNHARRQALIRGLAARNGVPLVDVNLAFVRDSRGLPALMNADGVHPASLGKELWADTVFNATVAARY